MLLRFFFGLLNADMSCGRCQVWKETCQRQIGLAEVVWFKDDKKIIHIHT